MDSPTRCPACYAETRPGTRVCEKCGAHTGQSAGPVQCRRCGSSLRPDISSCEECGLPVERAEPAPQPEPDPEPAAEWRPEPEPNSERAPVLTPVPPAPIDHAPSKPAVYARRAFKGAVFGTRAIVMQTIGLLIGQALFFVILLRDVPQPGALARGALSDAAAAIPGVDDALASELAGQAVSYVDQSLLGGLIGFADNIRFLTWLGVGLSLLVFAIAVAVIGRGATRLRWTGWALLMAGGSLFLWAGFVTWLGSSAGSAAPDQVAATVQRFAGALVAPMWPFGIALLVAGSVMVAGGWANLMAVILRRRRDT